MNKNRLIILTGPSCVGKTPLLEAFNKLYPQQSANLKKIVLYNSRPSRPSEIEGVDYYFMDRSEIESFRNKENFIVLEVRGDLQALDTTELIKQLENNNVIYEGNTFIAKELLQNALLRDINKLSIFISPFSEVEILQSKLDLGEKGFENYVYNTMKSKLIRRAKKFELELTEKILQNIKQRAADAFHEIKVASMFDFVIPNHDGEGSDNWNEPIPENSDAYLVVKEFSLVINNMNKQLSEKWKEDLIP